MPGTGALACEAWGAHLPFHPSLPTWAMDAGAGCASPPSTRWGRLWSRPPASTFRGIWSQGDLVDPAVLKAREDLLGTTSPSVLLYAALDGWRQQMVEHGHAPYDRALALAEALRAQIEHRDGFHVHGRADFCAPGRAADMDPCR